MSQQVFRMKQRVRLEPGEEGEDGTLFDSYTATMCAANKSAWLLLTALQIGARMEELVHLLRERFAISEEQARRDVIELLRELKAMSVVDARG
jgi:hypothetical protein